MLRNRRQECHRAYRQDAQFLIEYLATRLTQPRLVVSGLPIMSGSRVGFFGQMRMRGLRRAFFASLVATIDCVGDRRFG